MSIVNNVNFNFLRLYFVDIEFLTIKNKSIYLTMFSLTRVFSQSSIISLPRAYSRFKIDPGINRRKNLVESNEELDDLDDLESDFMSVHKTHREHIGEVKDMLEKEKYHIVKQKYFKEKFPNFLTWNDKEQIKYLHSTNPEEWSIDRLSEGFPALPDVIQKVAKSKWTKKLSRVRNHDLAVQANWEMFKRGQIPDLPEELVEHLKKFTNRALNLKPFEMPKERVEVVNKSNVSSEFSDIITSYERLKNRNKPQQNVDLSVNIGSFKADGDGTGLTVDKRKLKQNKGVVTLHELQSNIESDANKGKCLSEDDKLLLNSLQASSEDAKEVKLTHADITTMKYNTREGVLSTKPEQDYSHLIYPEKITIPKNLRKGGYTYKLNDCYYDDNGTFLYRVPGMI